MNYFKFVKTSDVSNHGLQFYLDGMNEENGEISGVFKRIRRGDYGIFAKAEIDDPQKGITWVVLNYNSIRDDLLKEIGDRHWYATRFLQEIGADWGMIESMNQLKITKRMDTGTLLGHGDRREDEKA